MIIPLRMVQASATAAAEQPCAAPMRASVGSRSNVLLVPRVENRPLLTLRAAQTTATDHAQWRGHGGCKGPG
jgi:hypothetical protein